MKNARIDEQFWKVNLIAIFDNSINFNDLITYLIDIYIYSYYFKNNTS